MTGHRIDPLTGAFDRARLAGDATDAVGVPSVSSVCRRGTRLRRRREFAAAGAALGAVLVVVAGVTSTLHRSDGGPPARPGPVSPVPTASGRSADGLLLSTDLGSSGWTGEGQAGQSTPTSITVDGCADGAAAFAPGDFQVVGRSRLYRGSTSEGAEWLLTEQVGRITPKDRVNVLALFRAIGTCRDTTIQVSLAADETAVAWGTPLTAGAVGAIGPARAFALVGDTLISLDALPGGAGGGPALPGQTRWMLDTLSAAVERATGSAPKLPEPSAAAEQAAQHYRRLDPGQVTRGTSGGAGQRSSVPAGFLTPEDLGTSATWSAGEAGTGTPVQAQLPGCANGSPVLVYGKGTGQPYRGVPSSAGPSGPGADAAGWGVYEVRITVDPTTVPTVQAALAAAARCPRLQVTSHLGPMTVETAGPTRALVRQDRPDGSTASAFGWILHGTTLVQLEAETGDPTSSPSDGTLPGGAVWFRQIMDQAETRMDG
jgi:hypothetical protein